MSIVCVTILPVFLYGWNVMLQNEPRSFISYWIAGLFSIIFLLLFAFGYDRYRKNKSDYKKSFIVFMFIFPPTLYLADLMIHQTKHWLYYVLGGPVVAYMTTGALYFINKKSKNNIKSKNK
jgi:hypothetical protein